MANTVARPRRSPRRESFTWRSLGWLLRREAMLRVWYDEGLGGGFARAARSSVLHVHPSRCVTCTRVRLALHPERAHFTPRA